MNPRFGPQRNQPLQSPSGSPSLFTPGFAVMAHPYMVYGPSHHPGSTRDWLEAPGAALSKFGLGGCDG